MLETAKRELLKFMKELREIRDQDHERRTEALEAEASFWQEALRIALIVADELQELRRAADRCAEALEEMTKPLFEDPKPSKVHMDPAAPSKVAKAWESWPTEPDVIRPREEPNVLVDEWNRMQREGTGSDPSKR